MSKKKAKEYSVGFKQPPRHTQFQPGQSGNPHGRPKKKATVADVIQKELNARVAIVKDGKRQNVPMLTAIIKQLLTLAAKGDSKAFSNLMKTLKTHQSESGDNLATLVQEFRAIHAQGIGADQEQRSLSEIANPNDKAHGPLVPPEREKTQDA